MRRSLVMVLLVACGGASLSSATQSNSGATRNVSNAGTSVPSDGTPCGTMAVDYRTAFAGAVVCDPAAPNACTEWRPVAVATAGNGGNTADARITGLCFTAGIGYVPAAHTPDLDLIIDRYKAAACKLGACPSPSGVRDQCVQRADGKFTCGGL